jgi:alpha-L-fucosidase 2
MKKRYLIYSLILFLIGETISFSQSVNTLWHKQPAHCFEETYLLGNGKMGASVFGGVTSEKIFLNDATLWSGEPVNPNMNPEAYKNLPAVREALKNNNYKLADQLQKKIQGKYSESYAPLGTLLLTFLHEEVPQNYYRELNISEAVSKVNYEINGIKFTREYFVSYPDQVMAIKITTSKEGALDFAVGFESLLKTKICAGSNVLKARGYAPFHAEPSYRENIPNAVVFDEKRGTRFTVLVQIKNTDGTVTATDSTLCFKNGTEALLLISIATSFNGFDKDPAAHGLNDETIAYDQLGKSSVKSYGELKNSHLSDYQRYFNRVRLNLGKTGAPDLPTDERLKRYSEGKEDKNLEILYFQYGRYLLISSSRTPAVPCNLQGIWNPYLRPPWSSNYTTNINVEENYWLAENANLSEMHLSLLGLIKNISETGAITAKTFYGVNGWAACHNTDIWAMSNPVGDFGEGDPCWANWNMGGVWLCTHLWDHYAFTQDKTFLKNFAYPIMHGAAEFCLEWLTEDRKGKLITSPSVSPENEYITSEGYIGQTLYGSTADLAMIRELFLQTIEASEILNMDAEFISKLKIAMAKLSPYKIGKEGNLQEWYYDWADKKPGHNHQSHLFGLYPGNHITTDKTPELANACRRTLDMRGSNTAGWSKAWKVNLWARLWDGDQAYKMFRELLRYIDPARGGSGTFPNLSNSDPPFQVDGNFAGSAAMVEMLLQSSENEIRLLPALPDDWESGSVSGICARGGFEIAMEWSNKELKKLIITSKAGRNTTILYGNKQKKLNLKKGRKAEIDL